MTEGLQGSRTPREQAEAFLRLGDFVKEPAPTPLLNIPIEPLLRDKVERVFGEDFVKVFGSSFDTLQIGTPRSVPEELAIRVRGMAKELLEPTMLTPEAKEHLLETIEWSLDHPMVGFNLVLQQCGIDLEQNRLGIFDPEEAPEVEKEMIRFNYPNPYVLKDLAQEHNEKMDRWVAAYQARHGRNPLED